MSVNPYSPPHANVADISPISQPRAIDGFRDLSGLVTWLRIALAALTLLVLAHIVSTWLQIGLLSAAQSGAGITRDVAMANDARQGLLSILYLIAYIPTGVLFLRWTYLMKKNAMALGAPALEFEVSPGWSVGSYFVPFLNLVAPYKGLKEAFQASDPEFRPDTQRLEWASSSKLLPIWWALWLVHGFLGQAVFQYSLHAKTLDQLIALSWGHFASEIIHLPLNAVVWVLISTLQRRQTTRITAAAVSAA